MPSRNDSSKSKSIWIIFGALDAGVILLFWGYSEFFGSHNLPILSNICFFGFTASVLATLAGFLLKHWPHKIIIGCIYVLLCAFSGTIIYEYAKPPPPNATELKTPAVTDADANPIGLLLPANDPMPKMDFPIPPPPNSCFFIFGGNITAAVPNSILPIIRFHETDMLKIGITEKGAFVSGQFFGKNGQIVAILETNQWTLNRHNYFRKLADKSTLIVTDTENIEVLNIRFCDTNVFSICGVIRFPDSTEAVITTNVMTYMGGSSTGNKTVSMGGFWILPNGIGWGIPAE